MCPCWLGHLYNTAVLNESSGQERDPPCSGDNSQNEQVGAKVLMQNQSAAGHLDILYSNKYHARSAYGTSRISLSLSSELTDKERIFYLSAMSDLFSSLYVDMVLHRGYLLNAVRYADRTERFERGRKEKDVYFVV